MRHAAKLIALVLAGSAAACGCFPDWAGRRPDGGRGPDAPLSELPRPEHDGDRLWLGRLPGLKLAAFGDSRPEEPGGPYPTALVAGIFAGAGAPDADDGPPDLLLFLGDTMYVAPSRYAPARAQLREFLTARAAFPGPAYFAVGNHEGWGENLQAFRDAVQPAIYFELDADTDAGEAKIVVVADNPFEARQEAWLRAALARPTAITIVARHYPMINAEYRNAEIAAIIAAASPDLVLSGHTHGYRHPALRQVVSGTGGAPRSLPDDFFGWARVSLGARGGFHVRVHRADRADRTEGPLADAFEIP